MKNHYLTLPFLISILLLVFGCKPSVQQALIENSQKFRPTEAARALMIKEVKAMEDEFDPEYNSLKTFTPKTANRYHSTRVGMYNHPVRGTSRYAVKLLETGDPVYVARAHKVIEAIIAAQDQDSASETYGIWPYYFEEPLDQMNKPDWNWADFNSVSLLEAYMKYNDLLADDLKEKMKASIIHASYSIKKRDVKPGYTNIAIMGTLVTHLAGQLFGIVELQEYADMRMKRFYDYTRQLGGFVEYNSPTYTRVALDELVRMKQYILDLATLEMVDYCYHTGWKVLATHFHLPTGQLAGPHSRSYSTLIRQRFYNFLNGASGGQVNIGQAKIPDEYFKLQHKIPDDLMAYFTTASEERIQVDTFSLDDNPPIGYAYLTKGYCFGTVNRSTTWQQRRPYLMYWGDETNPRYLSVRLLHDYEDFGIGNIFSARHKNEALTAMNFATNGGDYHISIDRLEEGKFVAKDVRLRFEIATNKLKDKVDAGPQGLTLRDGDVRVTIRMLHAVFGDEEIKMEKGGDDQLAWVDYIIYNGEERHFDLSQLNEACFAWYTSIGTTVDSPNIAPEVVQEENQLTASAGAVSISIPVKPALENDLQSAFRIKTHQ